MTTQLNRREAMALLGATAVGVATLKAEAQTEPAAAKTTSASRALRIAHLTDIHVQPERHANEGLMACLRHVHALADRPDFILAGGDLVFDSLEANNTRTALLWNMYRSILKNECDEGYAVVDLFNDGSFAHEYVKYGWKAQA